MYTHTCTQICSCTHTHTHICTHANAYMHMHIHRLCTCTSHTHAQAIHMHACTHARMHMLYTCYAHSMHMLCTCTYNTHTCIRTHMYIRSLHVCLRRVTSHFPPPQTLLSLIAFFLLGTCALCPKPCAMKDERDPLNTPRKCPQTLHATCTQRICVQHCRVLVSDNSSQSRDVCAT